MSQTSDRPYIRRLLNWLRDRELDFELAAHCAGLGVWHWDLVTNEIVWSDRCREMLGIASDLPASIDVFLATVHPEDRAGVASSSHSARVDRGPHDHEYRIVLPNGDVRWLHSAWRTQFDASTGAAVQALGVLLDVTERRGADEVRRLWAEAFVHNTRGIAIADPASNVLLSVNATYAKLLGLTPEELQGRSVLDAYPATEHVRLVAAALTADRDGSVILQACQMHRDGTLIPVEISVVSVRDPEGHPSKRIVTVTDLRERLRMEGKVRHAEAELFAAQRSRQLADCAPVGILLMDVDGACQYANPCWLQISGLYLDQARDLGWWDAVHPDDRSRVSEAWERLHQGAQFDLEFRYQRTSGEIRWVHSRASALRDDAGATVGYVSVDVDITERLQQRAAVDRFHGRLRALAHRLERLREDERTELARKLHGTLRQNMTTLRLEIQTVRKLVPPDEGAEAGFNRLGELADRCLNDLRHIAFELHPPGIEDLGFVGALKRYAEECAEQSGLRIDVAAPESLPDLGHRRLVVLYRTFQEALTNVVRHAKANRVEVCVGVQEGSVRLRITDDGVGLGDGDRNKPGTFGLLSASERLAQIGGTLRVFGVPGHGTTVDASVPIRRGWRKRGSADA